MDKQIKDENDAKVDEYDTNDDEYDANDDDQRKEYTK